MKTDRTVPTQRLALGIALLTLCRVIEAATPVDLVKTDLSPLIREGAKSRVQFAVHVPHAVSVTTAGQWSSDGERSTWHYAVRIPSAVSMSFHATPAHLPSSAHLTVKSAVTTVTYGAHDVTGTDFWSRIQPGDTLEFTLDVARTEGPEVTLDIVSFQAGYRGLGRGVPDHPYYQKLQRQTAGVSNTSCVQNYQCNVTAANTPAAQATVGVVVANQYQCTGTLINDVPGDQTPYVLTARHCETGTLGGGSPGQASNVTVYWDATTPCGQTLGTLYDPGIQTQTGATTVVEQQDAWLIRLSASPVVTDAQFAGFDASGGSIQGGYTIQHALGYDKQFTQWFGKALTVQEPGVLGVEYTSRFWEVVNALGNIGPGASGSALIDQNNHLVGSLTLGGTGDTSGYDSCPVSPPSAPNGTNGAADFTSLAAVWSSLADTTSSTGPATLKSILDPGSSGTLVVPSVSAAQITFTASTFSLQTGSPLELTWSVSNATQCTASGGLPGDGWSGTLPPTGMQSVSEGTGGNVNYNLTCTLKGGGSVNSSVDIAWNGPIPTVQVYLPRSTVWTTRPAQIIWTSNVSPCAVSGGGFSLTGLPTVGSTTATQNSPGDVTYTVSCGSGPTAASAYGVQSYVTPSLLLVANGTDRLLGQSFELGWVSYADTCIPSGGAPNDGWANNSFSWSQPTFYPHVSTLGTYTYTLSCSSGPLSVQQSVTVTFEDNTPYVTASVSPTTTTYTASPADYITVNWSTNISGCGINQSPVLGGPVAPLPSPLEVSSVDGPGVIAPQGPGTYTLSVTCVAVGAPIVTSAPMTVTILPPPAPTATFSINPATVFIGTQQFTVKWSSTNTSGCTDIGNGQGAGLVWAGSASASSGSLILGPPNEPGQFTLGISCKSIDPSLGSAAAQAVLTVATPTAQLTASAGSVSQGQSFSLTWSSMGVNQCTASGGGANGSPWSGTLEPSGTVTESATVAGSFTYTILCGEDFAAQADVAVTVSASPSPTSSSAPSGGGKGGGGEMGLFDLCFLGALLALPRLRRAHCELNHSGP
jgi:hypothetical protein